jgi:hypothetical protein
MNVMFMKPPIIFVYLFLWRQTHGAASAHTHVALVDIAEATGACPSVRCRTRWGWLGKRRLIAVAGESLTAVPVYSVLRPWRRQAHP